ncbi:YceD family protein [Silicimonas sp. MF1-12-2]|uniref:YceD family protein n=1 Tax=Silicimonas sp. MF1-12-2 TaxID=3384793 RepID=UPI0039B5C626
MADENTATTVRARDITRPRPFTLTPDADTRAALAAELGILAIRKLSFRGELLPDGPGDLRLVADLGATVVQPCVVTLEPVTTRIDERIARHYVSEMPDIPEGDEVEMPEDDTMEPLPRDIDLTEVMVEALALALPPWPRAEGVDAVALSVTEPGKQAMTDDDAKPFAALKSLRGKLEGDEGENG